MKRLWWIAALFPVLGWSAVTADKQLRSCCYRYRASNVITKDCAPILSSPEVTCGPIYQQLEQQVAEAKARRVREERTDSILTVVEIAALIGGIIFLRNRRKKPSEKKKLPPPPTKKGGPPRPKGPKINLGSYE